MSDRCDEMEKALHAAAKTDAFLVALHTLAIEYQDKAITVERFAQRVMTLLAERFPEK